MNQILVTLEQGADRFFLRKMIENMKGVLRTSIAPAVEEEKAEKKDDRDWLENLHRLKEEIDPSVIDMDDERTRYIMSK